LEDTKVATRNLQQFHCMRLHLVPLAAALGLTACGGSPVSVGPQVPPSAANVTPLTASATGDVFTKGIYGSSFYGSAILGYGPNNHHNKPPSCTVPGVMYVNGIAVDATGNLIVPDGGSRTIEVFKGPAMCGEEAASIADSYGMPGDATSPDALKGTIVVANVFDGSGTADPGSLSLCTVQKGCTVNLTNSQMNEVVGVAQALNGDCWASSLNASGAAKLIYFKGCSGKGRVASHFLNPSFGGLDIDDHGHLVTVSYGSASLYVYAGCNPSCALVGGPFALQGGPLYGRLNELSTKLITGDVSGARVDVYSYRPTKVQYLYSFHNGFSDSADVEGVAFNPRSKE
jgi:hypothetical protein